MSALRSRPELTYSTCEATHCGVFTADDQLTHQVIVVESEGIALVQPANCRGWAQVSLDDFDLTDDDDLDDVVAKAIEAAVVRRL